MSLVYDNPLQPSLSLLPDQTTWQRAASIIDPSARWRTYLHQIGLAALLPWFQAEFETAVTPWPTADLWDIWHMVNGVGVTLDQRKIVVILAETFDASELRVPQEWVDIPDWRADYYIAAYADIDTQRLTLWGYTTHRQLKSRAAYNTQGRAYHLLDHELIQDFSAFWVAQQVEQFQPASLESPANLSQVQARQLIQQLSRVPEPRQAIPFSQWGPLFQNAPWRRQLYELRNGLINEQNNEWSQPVMAVSPIPQRAVVNLTAWADQMFDQGWQTLESLLPVVPSLSFRTASNADQLVTRGKKLTLSTETMTTEVVLSLSISPEADGRQNVRVQLYPADATLLPTAIALTLELPSTGEQLQKVQSSGQDNYIQLPTFRCPPGRSFRIGIALADSIVQEDFVS